MNLKKCAIIGCGFVGASIAFSLLESGLFSEMVLIDINKDKAEGDAMDLSHAIPFGRPMKIYAGDYSDLNDCYIVIITAGGIQKPGQSRLDLVNTNINILKGIVPNITKYNTDGILLVVSNPVDVLTYVTWKLSGFPSERVIGSGTVLDTARLKYLLGEHFGIDSRSIHAFIIGEHGDSELAVWSSANVSGLDLKDFCNLCRKCENSQTLKNLYEDVKNSAYEVIKRKGSTYYAIAMAVRRIVEAIVRNEHSVLPVSCYIDSHYGISDLYLGIPAIVGDKGIEKVIDIPLDETEKNALISSAQILKKVINDTGF